MRLKQWFVPVLALSITLLAVGRSELGAGEEAPGTLSFKAHNQIYNANGSFKKWRLTEVDIPDGDLLKGSVEFEVDLASVWEKASKLAEHLRTADFFDVAKYTTATVRIDRAKSTGENTYEAVASVHLHGYDAEVPVTFKVVSESPLQIEGSATLSRTAFGIGQPYKSDNERSIVEEVEILLELTLTQ